MNNDANIPPITEDDIANYLTNTPDFFERHAEVLAAVQLASPHGGRAVSLQERQAEMLRDKIRGLEQRTMEMLRNSGENEGIVDNVLRWSAALLRTHDAARLPERLTEELQVCFSVPQVAMRLWDVAQPYQGAAFTAGVSDNVRAFVASLTAPYCGTNLGFEPVGWLPDSHSVKSVALLPLRDGSLKEAGTAYGLLVLGSNEVSRFESDMATDFLERLAELASAAVARLR